MRLNLQSWQDSHHAWVSESIPFAKMSPRRVYYSQPPPSLTRLQQCASLQTLVAPSYGHVTGIQAVLVASERLELRHWHTYGCQDKTAGQVRQPREGSGDRALLGPAFPQTGYMRCSYKRIRITREQAFMTPALSSSFLIKLCHPTEDNLSAAAVQATTRPSYPAIQIWCCNV
jgi:hypothetical protein